MANQTPPTLRAAIEAIEKAQQALGEAVDRQWSGGHALRLSIPARPDRDTDILIADGLRQAHEGLTAALALPDAGEGLSLSLQQDPLAITALLADNTRERHLYYEVISQIRKVLGEGGRDALLADLPKVVADKLDTPADATPALTAEELNRIAAVFSLRIPGASPEMIDRDNAIVAKCRALATETGR